MKRIAPGELVKDRGGRFSSELGIDLAAPDTGERFKWFLADVLYGTRMSESLARRTWRGIWPKAEPPLSPLARAAAVALGHLRPATGEPDRALARLRQLWAADGHPAAGFAEFESALVREGLRLRRLASRPHTD